MTWFLGIKNILIAALIGLLLGGLVGYMKGRESTKVGALKETVSALEDQREADSESARLARRSDARSTADLVAVAKRTDTYRKEVKTYVPEARPADVALENPLAPQDQVPLVHRADRLLSGAVCVLDRAREGLAPDPAACAGNGKGGAPTEVTADDLIDNDLQVVGKYHELARKHNELVDYVDGLVKRHNGAKTETPND